MESGVVGRGSPAIVSYGGNDDNDGNSCAEASTASPRSLTSDGAYVANPTDQERGFKPPTAKDKLLGPDEYGTSDYGTSVSVDSWSDGTGRPGICTRMFQCLCCLFR